MISYNIGYTSKDFHSGILTYCPTIWSDTFEDLRDAIRKEETILSLFQSSNEKHVPPSHMAIFVSIEEEHNGSFFEWQFCIKMINIREYRMHWEKIYKREYTYDNYIKLPKKDISNETS